MNNAMSDSLYQLMAMLAHPAGEYDYQPLDSGERAVQAPAPLNATVHRSVAETVLKGLPPVDLLLPMSSPVEAAVRQGATHTIPLSIFESIFPTSSPGNDAHTNQGAGILGAFSSIASTVVKNMFGMMPLVSGIMGLFAGGDDKSSNPPLLKYVLPPSLSFQTAKTDTGLTFADHDQLGMPRAAMLDDTTLTPGPNTSSTESLVGRPSPQITVNIQAMDARSFLDRSGDIAAAVREAMLNLNSINDVVNEL